MTQEHFTNTISNENSSMEFEFSMSLNKTLFKKIQQKIISELDGEKFGKGHFTKYTITSYHSSILTDLHKRPRKITTPLSIQYQIKERLEKEKISTVDISGIKIPLYLRLSTETNIEERDWKQLNLKVVDNIERILRLSTHSKYYRVDLSIRYILENQYKTESYSKMLENKIRELYLDFNDFRAMTVVPGYKILYDVEFEINEEYANKILNSGEDTKITSNGLLKEIMFDIISVITGENFKLNTLIENYSKTPQVMTLTNRHIEEFSKTNLTEKDFVCLLKTDGVRNLVVITVLKNPSTIIKIYSWTQQESKLIQQFEIKNEEFEKKFGEEEEVIGIIDTELINKTRTQFLKEQNLNITNPFNYFYIFDVYYVFKDVRHLPFEERMNSCVELFKKINDYQLETVEITNLLKDDKSDLGNVLLSVKDKRNVINRFILKNFEKNISFEDKIEKSKITLKTVKDGVSTKTISNVIEVEFDGFILQVSKPYELKVVNSKKYFNLDKNYSFKLKPFRYNTIDFKLKNNNTIILPSYNTNNIHNKTEQINPIYKLYLIGSGEEMEYCLRENSRKKTTERFTDILFNTPFFNDLSRYDASKDDEVLINGKLVKPSEIDLNNKIVEMYFDEINKIWKIHKFRTDKLRPNGFKVGLSNISLIFDPLRIEHYYSNILNGFSEELITDFHNCSHKTRDIIFDKLHKTMIVKKFDQETINRTQQLSIKQLNFLDIAGGRGGDVSRIFNLIKKTMLLNLFATDISTTGLVNYVMKIQKFAIEQKRKVNLNVIGLGNGNLEDNNKLYSEIISRNEFAKFNVINMTFAIHYISDYLPEFVSFCLKLLASDYIIMLTFYDSEKLIERINKFKIFDKIQIDIKNNKALMPLPTIDKNGYREEPCMSRQHIDYIKTSFENFCNIQDFYPFESETSTIEDNKLYFDCVRTLIISNEA